MMCIRWSQAIVSRPGAKRTKPGTSAGFGLWIVPLLDSLANPGVALSVGTAEASQGDYPATASLSLIAGR